MTTRAQREKEFHDYRFANPSIRAGKVARFYMINRTVQKDYEKIITENYGAKRMLECGCGPGDRIVELARNGVKVIGIDVSQVALSIARKTAEKAGVDSGVTLHLMDCENLGFKDSSFDFVCGTGILHHLDFKRAIFEISRVLCRNGNAAFIEPLGHNLFIRAFRNLTPSIRSIDERPFMINDLAILNQYFKEVNIKYYYLLALGASLFVRMPGFNTLLRLLESLDRLLFRIPFLRKQAWQILITLSDPYK